MGRKLITSSNSIVASSLPKISLPFFNQSNESRTVYLCGEVSEDLISSVQQQILDFAVDTIKPIYLVISTYGGSVDEMFSLYDIMKFVKCPIYCVGIGKIMSAGSLILASGTKGHRFLGKHARIMIHSISGAAMGSYLEILNEADELKRLQQQMIELFADNTSLSKEKITELFQQNVDKYITPEQALEYGIVDKLI